MGATSATGGTCGLCGHWSESSESGLVRGTGYCNFLEKLTDRRHGCADFVTPADYARHQQRLAERHAGHLDD